MKHIGTFVIAGMLIAFTGCAKEDQASPELDCPTQARHIWSDDSLAVQHWFDMTTAAIEENPENATIGIYLDSMNATINRNNAKVMQLPCGGSFTHLNWDTLNGRVEPIH